MVFFRDFVIGVMPESPKRAVVTLNPEVGDPVREVITLPPEFETLFDVLDDWIHKEIGGDQSNSDREGEKLRLAHQLYATFFQGALEPAFQSLRQQDGGVRIVIQADPSAGDTNHWFLNMPWELMIAPEDDCPLCIASDISFVRQMNCLEPSLVKAPLLMPNPLKILVVTANAAGLKEVAEHDYAQPILDSFAGNRRVEVKMLMSPDLIELQHQLAGYKPHILHMTGHGAKPRDLNIANYNQLGCFYIPKGGESSVCAVGPMELIGILKPCLSHLRLVTLASCYLGRSSQQGFAEGFAASLCAAGVPAVAAFQFAVSFDAAKLWVRNFYEKLAEGTRLDSAMIHARGAIYGFRCMGRKRDLEYGSAMLFSRIADGRLFRHKQSVKIISRADEPIDIPEIDEDVIDLTGFFKGVGLKSAELMPGVDWNSDVYQRLKLLKSSLNQKMTISIQGRMHLSILTAVGFLFNETCGCQLEYEQVNRRTHKREVWRSFVETQELAMETTFKEGDASSSDLIACVSISNPTVDDAEHCFEKRPYRGLLHCFPSGGWGRDSIPDDAAALALARSIGAEIKRVAQDLDVTRVHLFIACPLGFALFLGMQLNACRSVQLYEYQRPDYKPSILLR